MTDASRPRIMRWLGLVVAAWCGTLLLRSVPVGGEWQPISLDTWLALAGWLVAFAFGYTLVTAGLAARRPRPMLRSAAWVRRWIRALCGVAIIGAALIVYEFSVRRGYGFGTGAVLVRIAEAQGAMTGFEGSWVSGIGRMLTPALQVAWLLAVGHWRSCSRGTKALLLLATAVVLWQQIAYEGGRFFLAALVVSCLIGRAMAGTAPSAQESSRSDRKRSRRPLLIIAVVAVVAGFFGLVFLQRVAVYGVDLALAYLAYASTFDVAIGPDVTARIDGEMGSLWFVVDMFWIYVTQGPNELAVLLEQTSFEHAGGLYQFHQVGQALSKLSGVALTYDTFANLLNVGTYSTIVGAGYIDFGVVGALCSASLLGCMMPVAIRSADRASLGTLGLAGPLLVTLGVFSPIVSLVPNLWPAMVWAVVVGASGRRQPSPA